MFLYRKEVIKKAAYIAQPEPKGDMPPNPVNPDDQRPRHRRAA
jgi:hypothetical protein